MSRRKVERHAEVIRICDASLPARIRSSRPVRVERRDQVIRRRPRRCARAPRRRGARRRPRANTLMTMASERLAVGRAVAGFACAVHKTVALALLPRHTTAATVAASRERSSHTVGTSARARARHTARYKRLDTPRDTNESRRPHTASEKKKSARAHDTVPTRHEPHDSNHMARNTRRALPCGAFLLAR